MAIQDDFSLFVIRKDLSGGVNSRQDRGIIGENQTTVLYNVDLETAGQTSKRPGSVLIGNDISNNTSLCLHNYEIQGANDQLLNYDGNTLYKWEGSGNWASVKADFTAGASSVGIVSCKMSGVSPDDIVIVQNKVDNAFAIQSDGTATDLGNGNASPPITDVMAFYGNRVWGLLNDELYFSSAYPATYATAFDRTTNKYRIPVGEERAVLSTRDQGMIVCGKHQIWSLLPSVTPSATDQPQPIITDMGVVSKKGAINYGDDIFFFSQDGFRSLKRTQQDKLQLGISYPISHRLKTEFDKITWAYIENLTMISFSNKIFISVPTSSTTFDTWVYYPATDGFMIITGWSPAQWAKYKVSGEERLYHAKVGNGVTYRVWYGYSDYGTTTTNGTAITYQEESRAEDMGQPLVKKVGGVIKIRAEIGGSYELDVYASFDGAGYNFLGKVSVSGSLVTFPVTLPAVFPSSAEVTEKFPLDSYGEWDNVRIKIVQNTTITSDIKILERSVITYSTEFETEEA